MRSFASILFLALAAAACGEGGRSEAAVQVDTLAGGAVRVRSPAAGLWSAAEAWRPVEVARIGSVEGAQAAYTFGDVADVTLDPLGRVWVLDRQAKELRVFDPAGRHVRTAGGEGRGPGELQNPTGVAWDGAGRLWVADPANRRFETFDTAGRHVRSYGRVVGGWGAHWDGGFGREDGFLYEPSYFRDPQSGEGVQVLVRQRVGERELVPADTFALPGARAEIFEIQYRRGSMMTSVPYSPSLTWRFDGANGIWFGSGDDYRLVHRTLDGDTLRVVERTHTPVAVTAAERDSAIARLEAATAPNERRGARVSGPLDYGRIPAVKPAFQTFVLDDAGHLWVAATPAAGEPATGWDVFDPEGRYLGRVELELDTYPAPRVIGDRVVGVRRDELEVPFVVVYRLEGRRRGR